MPVASRPAHPRPELPGLPKRHGQCLPPLVPGATPAGCHWHQLAVHPVPEQNVLAFCRAYLILFGSISPSFAFVVLFFRLPYQRLKVRVQEIGGTLCGTETHLLAGEAGEKECTKFQSQDETYLPNEPGSRGRLSCRSLL